MPLSGGYLPFSVVGFYVKHLTFNLLCLTFNVFMYFIDKCI